MKVVTVGRTRVKEKQEGREMKMQGSNTTREEADDVTTTGRGKIEDNYWHKILLYMLFNGTVVYAIHLSTMLLMKGVGLKYECSRVAKDRAACMLAGSYHRGRSDAQEGSSCGRIHQAV